MNKGSRKKWTGISVGVRVLLIKSNSLLGAEVLMLSWNLRMNSERRNGREFQFGSGGVFISKCSLGAKGSNFILGITNKGRKKWTRV
jgi:hypothetical protein